IPSIGSAYSMAESTAPPMAPAFNSGSTYMRIARWMLGAAVALVAILPGRLSAQGITTGAIAGMVTDDAGRPLSAVQIIVRNRSTGFSVGAQTREDGRYRVQNLEVGGPYSVTARRIGLQPQTLDNQQVPFSQTLVLDFHLSAQVA